MRALAAGIVVTLLAACTSAASPAVSGTDAEPTAGTPGLGSSPDPPSPAPSEGPAEPAWRLVSAEVVEVGPREDHTWTLAPDGATAYLFGGRRGDGTALADLWAYDMAAGEWRAGPGDGPSARFGHSASWVDGYGLVVFGGQAGADFFNDLWAFDPTADAWRQLPAQGDVPVARYGSCAALGPDGRLWVSHGFTAENRRFADTRAYDFTAGQWTDETPVGDVPVARCLHGCWFTSSGQLALYAGQTTGVTALSDLWQLTPGPRQGTHVWSEVALDALPAARNLYAAARWGEATLVFGGQALDAGYLADAWLISDEGTATQVSPLGESPPSRSGAELLADEGSGRLLLFGGRDAEGAMADLWELVLP